jgi:hypothetical protein
MNLAQEFDKIHQRFDRVETLEEKIIKLERLFSQALKQLDNYSKSEPLLVTVKAASNKYNIHPNTLRTCCSEEDGRLKRYDGKGRDILIDENELIRGIERGLIKGTIPLVF